MIMDPWIVEGKEAEVPTVVAPVVYANRENIAEYGLIIDTEVPNAGLTNPFYKGEVEESLFPWGKRIRASWRVAD